MVGVWHEKTSESYPIRCFDPSYSHNISHCPWVDNCVGTNNHKHFILYVLFLLVGIGFLVRLTFIYISVLPETHRFEQHCAILTESACAEFSKDPLTIVTNIWGSIQLTWTFMLLLVHLTQVARNITTFETMRGVTQAGPLMTAITAGTMSVDGAQVDGAGAGPQPHTHSHKKKEGWMGPWFALLGIDTFITIAFQGYKGSQSNTERKKQARKKNLFTRGVLRNCVDFWSDGPVFGRKENCHAKLGGVPIDYATLYEVPRVGMRYRSGGYEDAPLVEDGQAAGGEV